MIRGISFGGRILIFIRNFGFPCLKNRETGLYFPGVQHCNQEKMKWLK